MKASGLLHALRSRNPARIRNPRRSAACSYGLASLMFVRLRVQAPKASYHGDWAFIVNKAKLYECNASTSNISTNYKRRTT